MLLWLPALAGCAEPLPTADAIAGAGTAAIESAAAPAAPAEATPAALPDDLPRTITLTANADDLGASEPVRIIVTSGVDCASATPGRPRKPMHSAAKTPAPTPMLARLPVTAVTEGLECKRFIFMCYGS